jgi:hypothetical protein
MIPAAFVLLESMPLSPNGKVERRKLPEPSHLRPELGQAFIAPRDELEIYLAGLWCEIINLDRVGVHDRFFELGGTSLQAARFINILQKEFNENIYVISIFESPTIAEYGEFLRHDYPTALEKKFGFDLLGEGNDRFDAEETSSQSKITAVSLSRMENIIVPLPNTNYLNEGKKNSPAIFILAPPRSGTTLLRVMLSGHPELFAGSELQLLGFNTLKERRAAYSGKYKLWLEGTIRAIMELKKCNTEEALQMMEGYEQRDYSTKDFYAVLQEWIGEKTLVDKSPSYALDMNTLLKAEQDFHQARYIHLVRHPYAMVRSFEKYHMDQVLYLRDNPFSARELGELVWLISHKNVMEFLERIPGDRQFHMRFEELVNEPRAVMEKMCEALEIQFHPELINPYDNLEEKMTDGIYKESKPMGDTHFLDHRKIDQKVARDWEGVVSDNFLSDITWDLAESLGYEDPTKEAGEMESFTGGEDEAREINRHERLEEMRRRRINKRSKR